MTWLAWGEETVILVVMDGVISTVLDIADEIKPEAAMAINFFVA